jgi:hypothetical protein
VSDQTAASTRIAVQSSRLWALLHFSLTEMLFSNVMAADDVCVSLTKVKFWLTPWVRQEENLPLTHVAELTHTWGLAWDTITVESSGGLNPLVIEGLPKGRARAFVDTVRKRVNEAPKAPT